MKQKFCPFCNGHLKPTPKTDVMDNGFNIIHIQIYQCLGCGREIKITVPNPPQTTISDQVEPVFNLTDNRHDDPLA